MKIKFSIASILLIIFALGASIGLQRHTAIASSDADDPPGNVETPGQDIAPTEILGRIAHRHDLMEIRTFFVEVRAYPGAGFPGIVGGFTETNVQTLVRLRGITVPTACHTPESRHNRPHAYIEKERARWAAGMDYVWSLLKLNKTLKIVNPTLAEDGIVEADGQFYLGGAWHDLGIALENDDFARKKNPDYRVEWGAPLLNIVPVPVASNQ